MDQGNPPRKDNQHLRGHLRSRHRHLRRDPNRGPPPRAERRKRVHVRRAEHVLQPRVGHLQPGALPGRPAHLHQQVQQLQDQGPFVPLLPGNAPVRFQPALDFQCGTLAVAAQLPPDVPRDCRLDPPTATRLLCRAPHGTTAHRTFPVPLHVGGTPLYIPVRALAFDFQVGL